jgi:alpha-glucosidase
MNPLITLRGPLISIYEDDACIYLNAQQITKRNPNNTKSSSLPKRIEKITRLPIILTLQDQLNLTLHALTDDIIRITVEDTTTNSERKSHMILNGKNVDVPWEGRRVNDLSHYPRPSVSCLLQGDEFSMTTSLIRVMVKLSPDGVFLQWADVKTNEIFLQDLTLGAYTFVRGRTGKHILQKSMDELYYGFGEASGELNKVNRRLRVDACDAMGYNAETTDPLYKHCPFYMTLNSSTSAVVGLLYDTYHRGVFDLGQEISAYRGSYRYFEIEDCSNIDYYVLYGGHNNNYYNSSPHPPTHDESVVVAGDGGGGFPQVSKLLLTLLGSPRVPPMWALGYLGSSMTYAESGQDALEKFPAQCAEYDMPCDGFHLSSGYTVDDFGRRCVFTWNPNRVRNPKQLFTTYEKYNINIIANIKPWLLLEHPQYENVLQQHGFLQQPPSNETASVFIINDEQEEVIQQPQLVPFTPAVQHFWKGGPGTSGKGSYLDFSHPNTREWWKQGIRTTLIDYGCVAAWCDNNEYEVDEGESLVYRDSEPIKYFGRSLQTMLMVRTSAEILKETSNLAGKWLVVSRSGPLGTHRYAAQTWSGDNSTSWHTMRWNIPMCLSLSLCLWVGNGPDVGGFAGVKPTEEMFLRWVQLGVWLPRFSIHSSSWKTAANTNNNNSTSTSSTNSSSSSTSKKKNIMETVNEPWMYPRITDNIRTALRTRCRLKPMLYSLHVLAAFQGTPVVRPLVYHYSNPPEVLTESFQFLFGRDVMCIPILEPGILSVDVLFPTITSNNNNSATTLYWFDLESGNVYQPATATTPTVQQQSERTNNHRISIDITNRPEFGLPIFLRSGGMFVLSGPEFSDGLGGHVGNTTRDVFVFPEINKSSNTTTNNNNNVVGGGGDQVWTWYEESPTKPGEECIKMYLTRNWRDGSYDVHGIKMLIPTVSEKCARCKSLSHVESNCTSKKNQLGDELQIVQCERCGRKTHTAKNCYAKTKVDGSSLKRNNNNNQTNTGFASGLPFDKMIIRELSVGKNYTSMNGEVYEGICVSVEIGNVMLF